MKKYTNTDVKRIANAMRRQRDDKPDRPYSLLTGAGCSKSAGIPLAGELVAEIKDKYKQEIEHRLGKDCDDDYGKCMSVLSSNEVKDIIQPYLDKAGVNWGHLAIAALMKAGFVGRVLTFNFDSILAKSCGLLGLYPATYDFVSSVSTRTDHIAQTAILHLHGQGHSLSILNSDQETQDHAENLRPLLTETFSRAPLIVAGYSGQADAVFDVIRDIYSGAERLHWVGYEEACDAHVDGLLQIRPYASEFIGGADSDIFFMDLAKELDCWPPMLFENPYAHLLEELSPITDYPDSDTDILTSLKAELKEQADAHDLAAASAAELLLDGDFNSVIDLIGDNPSDSESRTILAIASVAKAIRMADQLATGFDPSQFNEMQRLYEKATNLRPDNYYNFYNWGIALQALAEQTQDEALFRDSFEKYAKAIEIKPDDHNAFYNWGTALVHLARQTQDETLFRQSFEKFAKAIEIKPDDHGAYYNWGCGLDILARQTQDEALFRQCFEKFAKAIEIKPDNLKAFNNWGTVLVDFAKQTQDENLFRQSFEKFAKAIEIKPDYYEAFDNWGSALMSAFMLTKNEDYLWEAADILEQARTFKPDKLYNVACLRAVQGRPDDAMKALLHCEQAGTLPKGGLAHLQSDTDLDPLREREDFKALLERQK